MNAQWEQLAPLLPPPAQPDGRPRTTDVPKGVDAVLYWVHTDCGWRHLPHDFPASPTVHYDDRAWQLDGTRERVNARLRPRVRVAAGREPEPEVAVIGSQSMKATERGGEPGFNAGNINERPQAAPARRRPQAGDRLHRACR